MPTSGNKVARSSARKPILAAAYSNVKRRSVVIIFQVSLFFSGQHLFLGAAQHHGVDGDNYGRGRHQQGGDFRAQ